ncbi:MAG: hypothetical protein HQK49_14295 [Oligoflexia bacterium]|nr:hypothetical protein [Oligoflexia bacterium]
MSTKKIDIKLLTKLIEEREKLLQEKPHLQKLQKEIDELLQKIGDDPNKRMIALNEIMMRKFKEELIPALNDLSSTVNQLKKSIEPANSNSSDEGSKNDNLLHL